MTQSVSRHCPQCKVHHTILWNQQTDLYCPQCQTPWTNVIENPEDILSRCPICSCRQFYTAKDFNHALGCLIMLIGIILVPWTFGLSLPVFALIDWLIHKRVTSLIVCYKCGTEYRGFENSRKFKPFMHHIGLKYDKYR